MKLEQDQFRLSATDLVKFAACEHATRMDLAYLQGENLKPAASSDQAALLQRLGEEHEQAYLRQLESEGRKIVRIERENISELEAIEATRSALEEGAEIIYQAALYEDMWGGYADFLERVPAPSELGDYSYEAVDTKLKRKPDPSHVLQLYVYSKLLAEIQGRMPDKAHVLLGNGERASYRLEEYADSAIQLTERLEHFIDKPSATRPVPCSFCTFCRWREHCAGEWQESDSLFQITGITKNQVAKIEKADIFTMTGLAGNKKDIPELANATAEKLIIQARLQTARKTGHPAYLFRPEESGKGFALLPPSDHGDLFYDIEGDPFYSEHQSAGLEYLHGIWDGTGFTALWAHDLVAEKRALQSLIGIFDKQFKQYPRAHVYHYAAYEITALNKLVKRHGVGKAILDRWLREQRFVDLYKVVRGGIYVSEPSYSLKDLETFYALKRDGEVVNAGSSIVAYERWRKSGEKQLLIEIENYNQTDCMSLEGLQHWLYGICQKHS